MSYFQNRLPLGNLIDYFVEFDDNSREVIVRRYDTSGAHVLKQNAARQYFVDHLQLGDAVQFYAKPTPVDQSIRCRRDNF